MLITQNGQIDAKPGTSMIKVEDEWKNLLTVPAPGDLSDDYLENLFTTDFVEDDTTQIRYENTEFYKIAVNKTGRYVWAIYGVLNRKVDELETIIAEQDEVLNLLGVETEVVENAEN